MNNNIINQLQTELLKELPGEEAQNKMAPKIRWAENIILSPENAKKSAVLILLFPYKDKLSLVFIKRNYNAIHHSGQIAFPGGTYEPTDKSLIHTALREAKEEVGVDIEKIKILGTLTPLYIPVSNYKVSPIVAYTSETPSFIPDISEVQKIIIISIDKLFLAKNTDIEIIRKYGKTFQAPFYYAQDEHIWGATAMILSEFSHILNKIH